MATKSTKKPGAVATAPAKEPAEVGGMHAD
jgi:hypothetical protein